jgi:hypothetical protein
MNITNAKNRLLQEELGDFKLGQSKSTSTGKHTITDIDDTTGSITWKIEKEFDEDEIYNDLTKIIEKLEKIALNKFHKNPKLTILIKELKTTRNRLKRNIKEIRVNNPHKLYLKIDRNHPNEPYFELNGNILWGYLGDNEFIEFASLEDNFEELCDYLDSKKIPYATHEGWTLTIPKEYLYIKDA